MKLLSRPQPFGPKAGVRPLRPGRNRRFGAWARYACFAAVAGSLLSANAGQTYTTPIGQLTITTPEGSATFTGPNNNPDSSPVLQCRAGYSYSVSSYCYVPNNGKFDPQGEIGVERYYAIRHGGNLYDAPVEVQVGSKDWPANSGLGKTRTYGPYTAADYLSQSSGGGSCGDGGGSGCGGGGGSCGGGSCGNAPYLKETIVLGYYNKHSGTRTAILASANIYVFPPAVPSSQSLTSTSTQVQFTNVLTNQALNNSTSSGDPPVVQAALSNLYPGGTSYLRIYPGKQTSNPSNVTIIPNTTVVAPWGDISSRTLLIPTGPYLRQQGYYTIEAIQQVPAYGTDPVLLNTATFNASLGFAVHAEVGTVIH
ncbi:MAG: hypothetical protein JO015_14645 [Verrucomicrobia bacterium]|nr:hypothetical protein [Verrucomicrobiota bacterium]